MNIVGSAPNLEDIFDDIIDKNFEYGGETKAYPKLKLSGKKE